MTTLAAGAAALGALAPALGAERTVIVPGRIVAPDGSLQSGRAVVIENGRIAAVEDAAAYEDDDDGVERHPDAVLSPGLIDLASSAGVVGAQTGGVEPIEPELEVTSAIDASRGELDRLLRAGVTSVHITPALNRIVPGVSATIRTHTEDDRVEVLRGDGPLMVSMGAQVFDLDLGPTSRSGATFLLRDALESPEGRLEDAVSGDVDVVAYCQNVDDYDALVRTLGEHGIDAAYAMGGDLMRLADGAGAGDGPFIVGPLAFDSPPELLNGPAALADRGAEVVLRGGTPSAHESSLRITAALATIYGLDADAARRAITSGPAGIAGVDGRVGSISEGLDADLVLFSGDPLALDARVRSVWVKGEPVYAEPPSPSDIGLTAGGGT